MSEQIINDYKKLQTQIPTDLDYQELHKSKLQSDTNRDGVLSVEEASVAIQSGKSQLRKEVAKLIDSFVFANRREETLHFMRGLYQYDAASGFRLEERLKTNPYYSISVANSTVTVGNHRFQIDWEVDPNGYKISEYDIYGFAKWVTEQQTPPKLDSQAQFVNAQYTVIVNQYDKPAPEANLLEVMSQVLELLDQDLIDIQGCVFTTEEYQITLLPKPKPPSAWELANLAEVLSASNPMLELFVQGVANDQGEIFETPLRIVLQDDYNSGHFENSNLQSLGRYSFNDNAVFLPRGFELQSAFHEINGHALSDYLVAQYIRDTQNNVEDLPNHPYHTDPRLQSVCSDDGTIIFDEKMPDKKIKEIEARGALSFYVCYSPFEAQAEYRYEAGDGNQDDFFWAMQSRLHRQQGVLDSEEDFKYYTAKSLLAPLLSHDITFRERAEKILLNDYFFLQSHVFQFRLVQAVSQNDPLKIDFAMEFFGQLLANPKTSLEIHCAIWEAILEMFQYSSKVMSLKTQNLLYNELFFSNSYLWNFYTKDSGEVWVNQNEYAIPKSQRSFYFSFDGTFTLSQDLIKRALEDSNVSEDVKGMLR